MVKGNKIIMAICVFVCLAIAVGVFAQSVNEGRSLVANNIKESFEPIYENVFVIISLDGEIYKNYASKLGPVHGNDTETDFSTDQENSMQELKVLKYNQTLKKGYRYSIKEDKVLHLNHYIS